jgi:hypothetical protein
MRWGLAVKVPKSVKQERKCIFRTSSIVLEPSAGSLVPGHKSDLPLREKGSVPREANTW